MAKKNDIENAIGNLKLHVANLQSRATKPQQREIANQLTDSVNIIIDYFNETETLKSKIMSTEDGRDLYLLLALGNYSEFRSIIEDAKDVPARYIYNYITHEDHNEDMPKRIYNAVQAWKVLKEQRESLKELYELEHEGRKILGEDSKFMQQLRQEIRDTQAFIQELNY